VKPYPFAIVLAISAVATAQKAVSVPTPVAKIYSIQKIDFVKGDWAHFFSYYDPEFVAIDPKGKKTTLSELRAELERDMKGTTNRTMKIVYTDCHSTPTKVEVSYVATSGSTLGKRAMKLQEVGTDTWEKKGNDWKETKTVDKSFGPIK
jgi:hypothetical protein